MFSEDKSFEPGILKTRAVLKWFHDSGQGMLTVRWERIIIHIPRQRPFEDQQVQTLAPIANVQTSAPIEGAEIGSQRSPR